MSLPMPMEPEDASSNDPKQIRASHEDRDLVAEALRVAAGDGRLSMDELDERLEAALTARTYAELVPLLADLPDEGSGTLAALRQGPAAAPAQPKDVVRAKRVGGSLKYTGPWLVPKLLELEVRGGSVVLDYSRATVVGPASEVNLRMRGGSARILVPPGYVVDAIGLSMRGGSVRDRSGTDDTSAPTVVHRITVTGEMVGGSLIVNPPRAERPQGEPRRRGLLRRLFGR